MGHAPGQETPITSIDLSSSVHSAGHPILAFLTGDGRDPSGLTLDELLDSPDATLEDRHDFIQWLFPIDEPSRAVPGSPILTPDDIAMIRASGRALANLHAAAERMKRFYGRTHGWRVGHDHNHLRITRIIRSLRLLAGDAPADGFRAHILALLGSDRDGVSKTTIQFWTTA